MQNQQLSDVKGRELVAAGHALANAIGMDTPLIEIAKMMAQLAARLDCALVRGDELQAQRDALAAEVHNCRGFVADHLGPEAELQFSGLNTDFADSILNSVRAEGIQMLLNKYAPHTIASSDASEFAARLCAGDPS